MRAISNVHAGRRLPTPVLCEIIVSRGYRTEQDCTRKVNGGGDDYRHVAPCRTIQYFCKIFLWNRQMPTMTFRALPRSSKMSDWLNECTTIIFVAIKSSVFSVGFRGTSWLDFAFIFLRWFKLSHIGIKICSLHDKGKQGIHQYIFNRKSISAGITHPQSLFKYSTNKLYI